MTRARDVANVLSTASELATDTETAAAISSHNSSTTSVHGISNTAALATQTYVQNNKGVKSGDTASRPGSPSNGDLYYNTETSVLEVYDGGWWIPNTTPGIPTSAVATNQPSGRAYNNGQASIAFSPATSGGKATSYTVTSTPGSYTATGSSSPLVVTGLQSSTQYTYAVTATGPLGTSSASSSSSGVTATTVPQAPTIGTATGADSSATLTFTAGATGGATISNYKYSTDGSAYTAFSPSQTTSPLTIGGLTNTQTYSFYLKAVNTNGDSAASSQSNSVLIGSTSDYESIATYNADGTSGTVTFTSGGVWANYKHLQLRWTAKGSRSAPNDSILVQLNGDTGSNYLRQEVEWDHTNGVFYPLTGTSTAMVGGVPSATYSNYFGSGYVNIYDINSTKNKPFYITGCFAQGGTASGQNNWTIDNGSYVGSTSAITSIRVFVGTGNWVANTKIALYGIKG